MALKNIILFCHVVHEKHTLQSANKLSSNSGICLLKNKTRLDCLWGDTLIWSFVSIWSFIFSQSVQYKSIKTLSNSSVLAFICYCAVTPPVMDYLLSLCLPKFVAGISMHFSLPAVHKLLCFLLPVSSAPDA